MKRATKERIIERVEELRIKGNDLCPSTIAYELGITTKEITAYLRQQDDLYLKRKAHARRPSTRAYQQSCTPMYYPSVWGFKAGLRA